MKRTEGRKILWRIPPVKEKIFHGQKDVFSKSKFFIFNPLNAQCKSRLYHNLRILLQSGITLPEAIDIIRLEEKSSAISEALSGIHANIINGVPLSEALRLGEYFVEYEIFSIRAGEETGKLPQILKNLSEYFSMNVKMRRKVIQVLTYPVFLIASSVIVLLFMLAFVVPLFREIFSRFNEELPSSTRAVLLFSSVVSSNLYLFAAGFVLIFLGGVYFFRRGISGDLAGKAILRTPLLGRLMLKIYLSRFCSSLGFLLASGVTLNRALSLSEKLITFSPLKSVIPLIRNDIVHGLSFSEAVRKHPVLPGHLVRLIHIGERSARLHETLKTAGEEYELQSGTEISFLTALLEPLSIAVIGILVSVILIAMYIPLFELSNTIK